MDTLIFMMYMYVLLSYVVERMLAAQNPLTQMDRPHQLFADAPPIQPQPQMIPAAPPAFMPPVHVPPMGMFNKHGHYNNVLST